MASRGHTSGETRLPGWPDLAIRLRPSRQARRMTLRVSRIDGRVSLSYPAALGRAAALAFAQERAEWLRGALAGLPARQTVEPGVRLPVAGAPLLLVAGAARRVRRDGACLHVPAGSAAGPAVAAFLKAEARRWLTAACARHARSLDLRHGPISLRDTRSRWGSCSASGRLSFSWRLAMAPPEVLDYVAAHEVAHLVEMNHSAAFWAVLARLCPDHAAPRRWLRQQGGGLHAWCFGN